MQQPIRAGELRHRITIQVKTVTRDGYGAEIPGWTALATIWASVEELTGREIWDAQKDIAEVTTRVKIRYRSGVGADMRAVFGIRIFDILAVLDPDNRRRELHLMCREVA